MAAPPPSSYAIPLDASFRFVHEPLDCAGDAHLKRFVGRRDELDELVARVLLSNGGAFLLTGYRGVGKSTFVNRVIQEIREQLPEMAPTLGPLTLVDVHLNVPRAMESMELMFHVLRGLYLRLSALNLLGSLEPALRRDLELAFSRTSRTISLKTSTGIESSAGVNLAAPLPQILQSSSGITLGTKRSRGETHEIAYLTYDDKAAEYDLLDLARRLSNAGAVVGRDTWRSRLLRRLNGQGERPATRLKILFVFGELDKIEDVATPGTAIDGILANLKTLFTTSGIAFLFVGGKDIHDRWLEDVGRGDSVYESVFSYALYLPPLWARTDPMCDPFLDDAAFGAVEAADAATAYSAFKKFLAFTGRGIPRRVLRNFNERVRWGDRRAQLVFSRDDVRQFRFFAELHDVLVGAESQLTGELRDDARTGRIDRQRLGLYYLVDWILLCGLDEFTLEDAIAASHRLSRLIAPAEQAAPELIRRLIDVLVEHAYVESVVADEAPRSGNAATNTAPRYRLVRKRLVEMGSLAGVVEQEAQAVIDETKAQRFGGRYEVTSVLGRGGMSSVYLARDRVLGRQVAIKELLAELGTQPEARERFRREAEALSRLQHENIVRIYDVGVEGKAPYIVMEFVEGLRLTDVIGTDLLQSEAEIVRIAHDVVAALDFIHQRGILWRDPKPGNIIITPQGRVVLLDFGISRIAESMEGEIGMVLGTPAYSSPEQLRGEAVDVRSDIYCVGIVLYQMVSGRLPFASDGTLGTALQRVGERPAPPAPGGISAQLSAVILKCLEPRKEDRYASAGDLLRDLPATLASQTLPAKAQQLLHASADAERRETEKTVIAVAQAPARRKAEVTAGDPDIASASLVMPDGTVRALTGAGLRIGRSQSNDLVIAEPAASRFQAELTRKPDGWVIADRNSRNSTLLNGAPITAPVVLRDGDTIAIGMTSLLFRDAPGAGSSGQRVRRNDLFDFIEDLRKLATTAPVEDVLVRGLDRAIEISRAERGFVMLATDQGPLGVVAARARGGVTLSGREFSTSSKIPEEVFQTGKMTIVTDLLDADLSTVHVGTVALGIRSILGVPLSLRHGGERVGVMYLDSRECGTPLSANIQETLRALAVEIAEIVPGGQLLRGQHEKQKLEQELQVVTETGQGLQPGSEHAGAFSELSLRMVPSRMIGGDFSHYVELDATRIGFVVGDVAGKGAAAAALGSFVLGALRSNTSSPASPAQTVAGINTQLLSRRIGSQFVTLFYGVLDDDGRLTYCNGGHVAPVIVRGGGVERLESGGMVLGIIDRAEYEDTAVQLATGDLVVAFSDGVTEAMNESGDEFGEARALLIIEQHRQESTSQIADALVGASSDFVGGAPANDDVTVMVVKYRS